MCVASPSGVYLYNLSNVLLSTVCPLGNVIGISITSSVIESRKSCGGSQLTSEAVGTTVDSLIAWVSFDNTFGSSIIWISDCSSSSSAPPKKLETGAEEEEQSEIQ